MKICSFRLILQAFTCGAFQNASDQKTEMEKIKERMAHEVSKIEERKKKIDEELREVQVSTPVWLTSAVIYN